MEKHWINLLREPWSKCEMNKNAAAHTRTQTRPFACVSHMEKQRRDH